MIIIIILMILSFSAGMGFRYEQQTVWKTSLLFYCFWSLLLSLPCMCASAHSHTAHSCMYTSSTVHMHVHTHTHCCLVPRSMWIVYLASWGQRQGPGIQLLAWTQWFVSQTKLFLQVRQQFQLLSQHSLWVRSQVNCVLRPILKIILGQTLTETQSIIFD